MSRFVELEQAQLPTQDRPVRGRDAQRVLAAELLQLLRSFVTDFTAWSARIQGRLVNDVLRVETVAIPATGFVARDWRAVAGTIVLDNTSTHTVTLITGGAGTSASATGVGVYPVAAGQRRTIAAASATVTFWGTPGDTFTFQAFAGGPTPVV